MLRDSQSNFLDSLEVSKRGIVKVAASMVLGKEATSKADVQKVLKTFEKSPDVKKETLQQYKQRAEFDDPKKVGQDFFKDLSKAREHKKQMNLVTARCLRQYGVFKVASRDVYEDLETGDFWKISEDKKHIIRLFKESDEGISDKKAAALNSYSIMGSTPGDGGVVKAESFDDAAATFWAQDGGTKEEILKEIKKRPGKKVSETEYQYGDYQVRLISGKKSSMFPVKPGDNVKDYHRTKYEVIEVSDKYKDVEEYDLSGVAEDTIESTREPGEKIVYVAVKEPGEKETRVFVYGEDGVTKTATTELEKNEEDEEDSVEDQKEEKDYTRDMP